jgi:Zn-dependent M28 family amino/carboxypeptidase
MVQLTSKPDSVIIVKNSTKTFPVKGFSDYVLWSPRTDSSITWKDEELVFAGFGIVAPEYKWNDYEGLDVKNKIVLVLVNDPGFGSGDSSFFKGNAMTYYGRWTYKFEEAARQGAKGCFVIHNTITAAYPFSVVQNSWNMPHLYLDPRGKKQYFSEGVGWMSKSATEKLFEAAGLDFSNLQSLARKPGFKAQSLHLKLSTSMRVSARFAKTYNVIGKITGSKKPNEYIIYTAHWDHLGIGKPNAQGDSIYNGAIDNASGTASLLELAKGFKSMTNKPQRSIIFLSVTAEEQGLWGSAYYTENPVYPIENTVANINIDCINPWGKMQEIVIVGKGNSEVEDYVVEEAKYFGRDVIGDTRPEKGFYFRSDHFNFAKVGIPAIYTNTGTNFIGKGDEYGRKLIEGFGKHYHAPSDEFDPATMNFEGGVEDLKILFQVGKRLSFENTWPNWKAGSEFKAIREAYNK